MRHRGRGKTVHDTSSAARDKQLWLGVGGDAHTLPPVEDVISLGD